MIKQPVKVISQHIHFIDQNGDSYCGNNIPPEDEMITVPLGQLALENIIGDHRLCGVCWCVWLSVIAE